MLRPIIDQSKNKENIQAAAVQIITDAVRLPGSGDMCFWLTSWADWEFTGSIHYEKKCVYIDIPTP